MATAATLQGRLERAHQILGLLLQLDIAVAYEAKRTTRLDLEPGKQRA